MFGGVKFVMLLPKFLVLFEKKISGTFWPNWGASWFKTFRHTEFTIHSFNYNFKNIVQLQVNRREVNRFEFWFQFLSMFFKNWIVKCQLNLNFDQECRNHHKSSWVKSKLYFFCDNWLLFTYQGSHVLRVDTRSSFKIGDHVGEICFIPNAIKKFFVKPNLKN